MKLTDCAFLTDENIDAAVVAWLRERDHEVLDIKEEGLFGSMDDEILERAFGQKQVIISQDSDFGTLVFSGWGSILWDYLSASRP
jgi:predicted nuclease of predicted toxin-antitoxin system